MLSRLLLVGGLSGTSSLPHPFLLPSCDVYQGCSEFFLKCLPFAFIMQKLRQLAQIPQFLRLDIIFCFQTKVSSESVFLFNSSFFSFSVQWRNFMFFLQYVIVSQFLDGTSITGTLPRNLPYRGIMQPHPKTQFCPCTLQKRKCYYFTTCVKDILFQFLKVLIRLLVNFALLHPLALHRSAVVSLHNICSQKTHTSKLQNSVSSIMLHMMYIKTLFYVIF